MEVSYSDHSSILVELTSQIMELVACRFRFENAWIKEKDCVIVVAGAWTEAISISIQGTFFLWIKIDGLGWQAGW